MRIIAGRFKGRKLQPPHDETIRPTSDRTRESLFNLLMHGAYGGAHVHDQRVLDLCCGTGALGLEALSRGARACVFVDQDKTAIALARDNAAHCGVTEQCQFIQADATRLPVAQAPVALVMLDAPYDTNLTARAYASLRDGDWLEPTSLVIVEQRRSTAIEPLPGSVILDERHYGKTKLIIYQCQ